MKNNQRTYNNNHNMTPLCREGRLSELSYQPPAN